MEAVAIRAEAHKRLAALTDDKITTVISFIKNMDDELTLDGMLLEDLSPGLREAFERDSDPTFWSPPFKTAAEATAWALAQDDDDEE